MSYNKEIEFLKEKLNNEEVTITSYNNRDKTESEQEHAAMTHIYACKENLFVIELNNKSYEIMVSENSLIEHYAAMEDEWVEKKEKTKHNFSIKIKDIKQDNIVEYEKDLVAKENNIPADLMLFVKSLRDKAISEKIGVNYLGHCKDEYEEDFLIERFNSEDTTGEYTEEEIAFEELKKSLSEEDLKIISKMEKEIRLREKGKISDEEIKEFDYIKELKGDLEEYKNKINNFCLREEVIISNFKELTSSGDFSSEKYEEIEKQMFIITEKERLENEYNLAMENLNNNQVKSVCEVFELMKRKSELERYSLKSINLINKIKTETEEENKLLEENKLELEKADKDLYDAYEKLNNDNITEEKIEEISRKYNVLEKEAKVGELNTLVDDSVNNIGSNTDYINEEQKKLQGYQEELSELKETKQNINKIIEEATRATRFEYNFNNVMLNTMPYFFISAFEEELENKNLDISVLNKLSDTIMKSDNPNKMLSHLSKLSKEDRSS